jgi:hypothetical protein
MQRFAARCSVPCRPARALYAASDDDPSDAPHLYGAIETALRPLLTRMDIEIAHGD